jgi:hypothetical protein
MRVSIIVTDDDGNTFEGEAELTATASARPARKRAKHDSGTKKTNAHPSVNLSSPIRPFIKRHARDMGGAQRFTLLLAHIAKGDTKKEVPLATIEKQWSKLKGTLGDWNRAHSTRAKDQEWVDSPKTGVYVLLPVWKGIFNA